MSGGKRDNNNICMLFFQGNTKPDITNVPVQCSRQNLSFILPGTKDDLSSLGW